MVSRGDQTLIQIVYMFELHIPHGWIAKNGQLATYCCPGIFLYQLLTILMVLSLMFWSKDKKTSDKQGKAASKQPQGAIGVHQEQNKSQRIREEALANARTARHEIGAETLDKIAALMTAKQQSAIEQAKGDIAKADADRVAREILWMLEQK